MGKGRIERERKDEEWKISGKRMEERKMEGKKEGWRMEG